MGDWCRTCDECMFGGGGHVCPPKWSLWVPEDGETEEDARDVYGINAEDAAEKWAENDDRNSAEYSIVNGNEATVRMRYAGDPARAARLGLPLGELEVTITGESVPSYSADVRELDLDAATESNTVDEEEKTP